MAKRSNRHGHSAGNTTCGNYRGVSIKLIRQDSWHAVLTDRACGVVFPTKVVARPAESQQDALQRAMLLVEEYLAGAAAVARQPAIRSF